MPLIIPQETLDALKAKHVDVHLITSGQFQVAARRLSKEDFDEIMELCDDGELGPMDLAEHALLLCRLAPSAEELEQSLDFSPPLADELGVQVLTLAGIGADVKTTVDTTGDTATMTASVGPRSITIKVRRPSRAEWKEIRRLAMKPGGQRKVAEALYARCAVNPDASMALEFPALPLTFGNAIEAFAKTLRTTDLGGSQASVTPKP